VGAIQHPFIKNKGGKIEEKVDEEIQQQLDQEVVVNLKKYRGQSVLKRAAMNVLVKQLAPKQIEKLKNEFEKIDSDLSGFIEVKELQEALKSADINMQDMEIDRIIGELDYA